MNLPNEFMLGCNYWASNAGTEMWIDFNESVIREDLKVLSQSGVKYLRVFPNWRDFQPVMPMYGGGMSFKEYRMANGSLPANRYFLDETMLGRFDRFCDICAEYGMQLIVGLLTGWMSGRVFVPLALNGKNLFCDTVALHFEQLFVMGFVEHFKDKEVIYAWDHGNETQCMSNAPDHIAATAWTQMISNAVRAVDCTRPLINGNHQLTTNGIWRADEQGATSDIMVSHPYPFWGIHTTCDTSAYIKTTLYPTAQMRFYSDLAKKPCLIEEFGTMGPSVCSEELAAPILRVNYFSTLANGGFGILWWCANEQTALTAPPYSWTMVENELGMRYADGSPKPVLQEMKRLSELKFDFELPPANVDAVCLLTEGQDAWGVAYMSYVLAKQAGLNISFADSQTEIPDADVYMLPSISGANVMPKENYRRLCEKVAAGAKLYISADTGFLTEFEALTGNKIIDSEIAYGSGTLTLNGKEIQFKTNRKIYIEQTSAEAICQNQITKNSYGKGTVYYVNFPVEAMLIDQNRAFDNNVHEIYREIFSDELAAHEVSIEARDIAITLHRSDKTLYVIAINHGDKAQKIDFITELPLKKIHYGTPEMCEPMDAVIASF